MFAPTDTVAIQTLEERLETIIDRDCSVRLRPALHQLVPRLAELLVETRSSPVKEVHHLVSRLVQEYCRADEAGDAAIHNPRETQAQVERLMRAMNLWQLDRQATDPLRQE